MKVTTRRETLLTVAGAALAPFVSSANAQSAPIKIGLGMASSGPVAGAGKSALLAYELWVEDVNARGGLLGRKVELVSYDDQSSPATVPGIYSKLLDIDKVDLTISGYGTAQVAAAMPIIMARQKLFMASFALAANEQFRYDRYFQAAPLGTTPKREFSKGYFGIAVSLDPKPKTVALVGSDSEYGVLSLEGARENAKDAGIKIVYDKTYPPSNQDFSSLVRAIKAVQPDLLYIASYPTDSVGLIRAIHEVAFSARLVGGGMVGLQFAAQKQQLGPLLNDIVNYDLYVPEPTMRFPGIESLLERYRVRAGKAGVDPLGFYLAPFSYAQLQVLEQAVNATKSLDDEKLAQYLHSNTFQTVVGEIKYSELGEWAEPRVVAVQFRGVEGNDVDQFRKPGKQVIVFPEKYKSGQIVVPFASKAG